MIFDLVVIFLKNENMNFYVTGKVKHPANNNAHKNIPRHTKNIYIY